MYTIHTNIGGRCFLRIPLSLCLSLSPSGEVTCIFYMPILTHTNMTYVHCTAQVFGYAYESVLCLNRMASALGLEEDAAHWNASG